MAEQNDAPPSPQRTSSLFYMLRHVKQKEGKTVSLEQTLNDLGLKEKEVIAIRQLIYAMDITPAQFQKDALLFYTQRIIDNPNPIGYTLCNKLKEMLSVQDGA